MTTSCPACGADVTGARDFTGAPVLLSPRPYPQGRYAAREEDGTLRARWLPPRSPLKDGETRYSAHTCPGRGGALAEARKQAAANAAAARNRRGRPGPRHAFGGASGVRVMPPGGAA